MTVEFGVAWYSEEEITEALAFIAKSGIDIDKDVHVLPDGVSIEEVVRLANGLRRPN